MNGTARPTDDGRLEVDIHAWVYERERRWGLNAAFARYLGLNLKKLAGRAAALQPAHRAVPCRVGRRQGVRPGLRRQPRAQDHAGLGRRRPRQRAAR